MSHLVRILPPILLILLFGLPAAADTINYEVVVNTSSQNGAYGYIDFELNAGSIPGSAPISASVFGFSGATLNPADPNNDELGMASGNLASVLTLSNSGFNDYFEGLTFGSSVKFGVTLSGSGISATGSAGASAGTTFQVFFFDSTIANNLFVSDAKTGAAALVNVSPSGLATTTGNVTLTPEPGTASYLLVALVAGLFGNRLLTSRGSHTTSSWL
jgi:hypothetical protein